MGLTGVEEDHGLQADVLLPLELQLAEARGGCQQHVEDLHDALHALALLPESRPGENGGATRVNVGNMKDRRMK